MNRHLTICSGVSLLAATAGLEAVAALSGDEAGESPALTYTNPIIDRIGPADARRVPPGARASEHPLTVTRGAGSLPAS